MDPLDSLPQRLSRLIQFFVSSPIYFQILRPEIVDSLVRLRLETHILDKNIDKTPKQGTQFLILLFNLPIPPIAFRLIDPFRLTERVVIHKEGECPLFLLHP